MTHDPAHLVAGKGVIATRILASFAITLVALIHLWGIRLAALVNDLGVIAEMIGAAAITLVLLAIWLTSGKTDIKFLLDSTNLATGSPATWQAFGLSLLLAPGALPDSKRPPTWPRKRASRAKPCRGQ